MAYEEFKKLLKALYQPKAGVFTQIEVPEFPFAMLEGEGDPTDGRYEAGLKWMYAAIQPIRRNAKKKLGKDFLEPPFETLWWADDITDLVQGNRDKFKWRMMIHLPHWVDEEEFQAAVQETEEKLKSAAPDGLRLEKFEEGLVVQTMHVGPNDLVGPTLEKLYHEYLPANGLVADGHYHEIYLGDVKRIAPEKRKTVLRQPVRSIEN